MEETTIVEQEVPVQEVPVEGTSEPTVVEQTVTPVQEAPISETQPTAYNPNLDIVQNEAKDVVNIISNQARNDNAGKSMNKFLTQDYDYNREEAGSYWVAGGINDKDTQMSFLNTIVNEEMYDDMDLQKYYYDTTMATARAYAANKERETAYGFYRAAQEKAIAEAQLTGWYMPAEGQYMLMQYEAALDNLKDPNADHIKANNIKNTTEAWFAANKITPRGIKCLSMMNYEENVRHNTIMGKLQEQANQIAAAQAGTSAAAAEESLKKFRFSIGELELQYAHNFSKEIGLDDNNILGYDYKNDPDASKYQAIKARQSFESAGDLLGVGEYYAAVLDAHGLNSLNQILKDAGKDPDDYSHFYHAYHGEKVAEEAYKEGGKGYIATNECDPKTAWKVSSDYSSKYGGNIYSFTIGQDDPKTGYYVEKNGVITQITEDIDIVLPSGKVKKLSELDKSFTTDRLYYDGHLVQVGEHQNLSTNEFPGSVSNTPSYLYLDMSDKVHKNISNLEKQGYSMATEGEWTYFSLDHLNSPWVMVNKDGKYMEVDENGSREVKSDKLVKFKVDADGNWTWKHSDGSDIGSNEKFWREADWKELALSKAKSIGFEQLKDGSFREYYKIGDFIFTQKFGDKNLNMGWVGAGLSVIGDGLESFLKVTGRRPRSEIGDRLISINRINAVSEDELKNKNITYYNGSLEKQSQDEYNYNNQIASTENDWSKAAESYKTETPNTIVDAGTNLDLGNLATRILDTVKDVLSEDKEAEYDGEEDVNTLDGSKILKDIAEHAIEYARTTAEKERKKQKPTEGKEGGNK